jgi:sugar lactone lactonase YvrE
MKALSEQLRLTEGTMNPMQTPRLTRVSRTLGLLAAVAGLVSVIGTAGAFAQNAAQRAALTRLGRTQANARPNNAPAGSVEAISVPLDKPGGLAFDTAGNLYIADTGDNMVREVNVDGVISTVAGDGEQGFGGDGGAATSALLDAPTAVAVDLNGNIYIADKHNNRIREVSGGVIATIAGTGVAGFSGDGGAATSAMLAGPSAIAIDSKGNIYIADSDNHRIREIIGTTISTVAGDGEQLYSGDGGLATAAGLDSPDGVAVDATFNIYIGDTHNQRVRLVTIATGIITTLAGTGVKGFTADGPAAAAALARPSGVSVDTNGNVYVADSDNNRIRTIAGGNVTTLAGSGTEGFSGDSGPATSASLDTPRAVTFTGTEVAFADTENNVIRIVDNGIVHTIGGQPPQQESIVISGPLTVVYGTGTLTATFSNGGQTATGLVTFYDGEGTSPANIGSASLSGNTASISTSLLSAGTHYIVASYAGDANDAAINSGVYVYVVTPAPLTALANAVSLLYGQAIPTLTGTLTGVLPQDAGKVTAAFSTTATITSAPGTYPIAVQLTGSAAGNYTVALGAGSGSVTIGLAPTTTTLTSSIGSPISGTSFTLTATVASTTSGTPAGTVNFFNGTTQLNTTPVALSGGVATFAVSSLPVGTISLVAVYSGNVDYATSTSAPLTGSVLSPDFTIAASPSAQTVLPSNSVNYTITLAPVNSTFVFPVSLSATGLPAGATATFAPSSVAAGAGSSTVVMTVAAGAQAELHKNSRPLGRLVSSTALALLMLPLLFGRRARKTAARLSRTGRVLIALLALVVLGAMTGCGSTSGFFAQQQQSYTVTVTGTSDGLSHSATVTLTVE